MKKYRIVIISVFAAAVCIWLLMFMSSMQPSSELNNTNDMRLVSAIVLKPEFSVSIDQIRADLAEFRTIEESGHDQKSCTDS